MPENACVCIYTDRDTQVCTMYVYTCPWMHLYTHICMYMHVYAEAERASEKERERESETEGGQGATADHAGLQARVRYTVHLGFRV